MLAVGLVYFSPKIKSDSKTYISVLLTCMHDVESLFLKISYVLDITSIRNMAVQ